MWWGTVMLEYSGELWCGMLQRTVTWNMAGNGGVKYGGERLMWNVVENGDIGVQRVIL